MTCITTETSRLEITQDDTGNLIIYIVDNTGAAVPLTGVSTFSMWVPGAQYAKIVKVLTELVSAEGKTRLDVETDFFDTVELYVWSVTTVFAGGEIVTTKKNEIEVEKKAPPLAP